MAQIAEPGSYLVVGGTLRVTVKVRALDEATRARIAKKLKGLSPNIVAWPRPEPIKPWVCYA